MIRPTSSAPESTATLSLLARFERLCLARAVTRGALRERRAGRVPGNVHSAAGHEAVAIGVVDALTGADRVVGHHRCHALAVAVGADVDAIIAEICGDPRGLSAGQGGTMHLIAPERGLLATSAMVGASGPLAVGVAQGLALQGESGVAVAFMGDGAMNRGPTFEAFNWAAAFGLRVLFVCEDNGVARVTATDEVSGGPGWVARARAFGLTAASVDGADVLAVGAAATALLDGVRRSGRPALLHARVTRLDGHYTSHHQASAADDGVDPVACAAAHLVERGVSAGSLRARERAADAAVAESFARVFSAA